MSSSGVFVCSLRSCLVGFQVPIQQMIDWNALLELVLGVGFLPGHPASQGVH